MDTPAWERISCLWLWPHHINQTPSQIIDAEVQWNVLCIQDNEMLNFPDSFCHCYRYYAYQNFTSASLTRRGTLKEEIANFWIKSYEYTERTWRERTEMSVSAADERKQRRHWNWRLAVLMCDKRTKERALAGYKSTNCMRLCWKASCRNDSQSYV